MVLAAALDLDALAVGAGVLEDSLPANLGPDVVDRRDGGLGEEDSHDAAAAVDDGEDSRGEPGVEEAVGEEHGGAGGALRGLEDGGVAGDEGEGNCPEGDHEGEVEGGDGDADAQGLVGGVGGGRVAGPGAPRHLASHPRGGDDGVEAALDLILGVLGGLADLGDEAVDDAGVVLLDGVDEVEELEAAVLEGDGGPVRLGDGGGGDGLLDLEDGGLGDAGQEGLGGGVVGLGPDPGLGLDQGIVDEVVGDGDDAVDLGGRVGGGDGLAAVVVVMIALVLVLVLVLRGGVVVALGGGRV